MTVLDLNHGATREASNGFSLRAVGDYLARRAIFRQTVNELNGLSDRELADLGIHRLDINRIARDAAARK